MSTLPCLSTYLVVMVQDENNMFRRYFRHLYKVLNELLTGDCSYVEWSVRVKIDKRGLGEELCPFVTEFIIVTFAESPCALTTVFDTEDDDELSEFHVNTSLDTTFQRKICSQVLAAAAGRACQVSYLLHTEDAISTIYPGLSRIITYGTSQLPAIVHLHGMLANCGIQGWSIHVYATRSNSKKTLCPSVQNGAERVSKLFFLHPSSISRSLRPYVLQSVYSNLKRSNLQQPILILLM